MKLKEIYKELKSDFTVSFKEPNSDVPFERMLALLPCDVRDDLLLELMYVPGLEGHLDECKLLQFFVLLHSEVKDKAVEQLRKHLLQININSPLVGFGLQEKEKLLYFKYMLCLPIKDNSGMSGVVRETVWLISYMLDLFLPTIEVITGRPESKRKK